MSEDKQQKAKKPFPFKKVLVLSLVVIIAGVLLWYSPTILSLLSNQQLNHKRETFQLPASPVAAPVNVSRSIQLRKGQTLRGNFTITGLPPPPDSNYYGTGVAILGPQEEVIALYYGTTASFSIPATTNGTYIILFTCTTAYTERLPLVLTVTLAYDIID